MSVDAVEESKDLNSSEPSLGSTASTRSIDCGLPSLQPPPRAKSSRARRKSTGGQSLLPPTRRKEGIQKGLSLNTVETVDTAESWRSGRADPSTATGRVVKRTVHTIPAPPPPTGNGEKPPLSNGTRRTVSTTTHAVPASTRSSFSSSLNGESKTRTNNKNNGESKSKTTRPPIIPPAPKHITQQSLQMDAIGIEYAQQEITPSLPDKPKKKSIFAVKSLRGGRNKQSGKGKQSP